MDTWAFLAVFGWLLLISPAVMAHRDGVRSDDDLIRWLINKPLATILTLQASMRFGAMLVTAARALGLWQTVTWAHG